MNSLNFMNKSSTRGVFLSIALLLSIALVTIPSSYAEEVTVKSFALEETTILEVSNESNEEVNTFRIWLGSDFSLKSFKTEEGWLGEKTPQGVIVFTSTEAIKPGESVKFGVKTDKAEPGINWKALDNDKQMDTGKVLPGELPKVVENTPPEQVQTSENLGSMSDKSTFRIVPEKPNVGSSIRVTGDQFGTSQEFDFYIGSKKLGSFETDEDGHFMTTMKIPDNQEAERVDFIVKDKAGEEKKISLRIGEIESRIPESKNIKLTIKGLPEVVHRGGFLEIFGTGDPDSAISADVIAPNGELVNSVIAEIDAKGEWELEPILVPLDREFGKYKATITDGRETIEKFWTVESDKKIILTPYNLKFEAGELMKFNGTALPNVPIEIVLEDPLGKEVVSDIIQVDDSGFVEFEYQTEQSTAEGTYTLIATQASDKEFIYAGLGQLPTIPVNLEFDKLSYDAGEEAIITLSGKGSEIISLLIVDPSDKPKGDAVSITLQPDGRGTYILDLDGFSSGVYSAVISKGSTQSTEIFTVGLQVGSGEIDINTTKIEYLPGDSVLILGDTGSNVLLTMVLIDPDGNEVKVRETFSDKNGKISEDSFRIPSDAKPGTWTLNAKSGSNFDNVEIMVLATLDEGMIVSVTEGQEIPGSGQTINISVDGAAQTVLIEIIAEDGEIIEELEFLASSQGEINQPWIVPVDTEPGMYTIRVSDAFNTAETTYEIQ